MLTKGQFSRARAQDKTKQYHCYFFFPFFARRTKVLENISDILTVSSPFTLFHYVLNKIFYNGKAFIGVLELSGAPTTYLDLDRVRPTLLLIC